MTPLETLKRSFSPIPMSIRPDRTGRTDRLCGVYLLVSVGSIVYVGSSANLASRLVEHRTYGAGIGHLEFDSIFLMPLPGKVLVFYEGALIRHLRPVGNTLAPKPRRHDVEILDGLGLPVPADNGVNHRLWRAETARRRKAESDRRLEASRLEDDAEHELVKSRGYVQ